jgi:predicted dehydrogenase
MSNRGSHDTEDDFSCSLRFPTGVASAHLSWQAGMRKVIYTLHGSRGAIRVEDDHLEVWRNRAGHAVSAVEVDWECERHAIPSGWTDSSHATWFEPLFEGFRQAIARGEWVGREAEESCLCVELIETAYASAKQGSRELPLPERERTGQATTQRRCGT